jgi:hypothetical protein
VTPTHLLARKVSNMSLQASLSNVWSFFCTLNGSCKGTQTKINDAQMIESSGQSALHTVH